MDNCDNSRNMTSTSVGLQSTGLNWCHFSIVDTKKCHRLEKGDRLMLKIKMLPAPAAEKGALLLYPRGTVYAFRSHASNYWEETELFGYRGYCVWIDPYVVWRKQSNRHFSFRVCRPSDTEVSHSKVCFMFQFPTNESTVPGKLGCYGTQLQWFLETIICKLLYPGTYEITIHNYVYLHMLCYSIFSCLINMFLREQELKHP